MASIQQLCEGSTFDPDALDKLTAAYAKATAQLNGNADPETVAKYIIALASEGERDPDRLCQGALARLAA